MRGAIKSQPELVCRISPDSVVPKDHPIRTIKRCADEVFLRMNRRLDAMYAREGRPSIPPERLLKAKVPIACSACVRQMMERDGASGVPGTRGATRPTQPV